jgi:membrane protease YdiL (CAAX protease family)
LAMTGKNRLSDYGIDSQGWIAEVRFGGLGYLLTMPFVVAVIFAMQSVRRPETVNPLLKVLETGHGSVIAGVAFTAVVAAPLTEELIFRVVFQGLLESLLPTWAAILFPAIAFAAMHGRYDALPLFPLALVLGIVYHLRRSYVAVVTIHAMFNATFLLLALSLPANSPKSADAKAGVRTASVVEFRLFTR